MFAVETLQAPCGLPSHRAALLSDGRLIVIQGQKGMLFHPTTHAWSEISDLPEPVESGTLTALADGRALAVGLGNSERAAVWEPGTGRWILTTRFRGPRRRGSGHTATLLADGRVLVMGGFAGEDEPVADCEVFDPVTVGWTPAKPMRAARADHRVLRLGTGELLVWGGVRDAEFRPERRVDCRHPASTRWRVVGTLEEHESQSGAAELPDGRVLFHHGAIVDAAHRRIGQAAGARGAGGVILALPDGAVVAIGEELEAYDATEDTWSVLGRLPTPPPSGASTTVLADGRIVLLGGLTLRSTPTKLVGPPRIEQIPSVLCQIVRLLPGGKQKPATRWLAARLLVEKLDGLVATTLSESVLERIEQDITSGSDARARAKTIEARLSETSAWTGSEWHVWRALSQLDISRPGGVRGRVSSPEEPMEPSSGSAPPSAATVDYVHGDATAPVGEGPKIIVHVCNDVGGWGRGFVTAISKRWREPEQQYRAWHRGKGESPFELGQVQLVRVGEKLWVANLLGQRGLRSEGKTPPIRYDAVRAGLRRVCAHARAEGASVHMPRIGCGLAGGRWEEIGPIVHDELVAKGVRVTVYDFA